MIAYVSWHEYDKIAKFVKDTTNDKNERIGRLWDFLKAMKVHTKFNKEKKETLLYIIDKNCSSFNEMSPKMLSVEFDGRGGQIDLYDEDKYERVYSKEGEGANHECFVPCSKILWLYDHNRIIMDRVNEETLEKLINREVPYNNDYEAFCNDWKKEFDKRKSSIDNLIEQLKQTMDFERISEEVFCDKVLTDYAEAFKQRVFDIYLINAMK